MTDQDTAATLAKLRALVSDARPVPMSSSCMVSRTETLALIDQAVASLETELADAKRVTSASRAEVDRGRDEGDRIRIEAEEWAQRTASQSQLVVRAQKQADEIMASAKSDSEALRAETDAYVDTRMAEFEAALAKVSSQVRTLRGRLANRAETPED